MSYFLHQVKYRIMQLHKIIEKKMNYNKIKLIRTKSEFHVKDMRWHTTVANIRSAFGDRSTKFIGLLPSCKTLHPNLHQADSFIYGSTQIKLKHASSTQLLSIRYNSLQLPQFISSSFRIKFAVFSFPSFCTYLTNVR